MANGTGAPIITTPTASSRQRVISANVAPLTDARPLVIAFSQPPLSNNYWLVSQVSALVWCKTPPQDAPLGPGIAPASGLFMCATQDAGETLSVAQGDISFQPRAIALDTLFQTTYNPNTNFYLLQMVWRSGAGSLVVPAGQVLIAIVVPHPGTATPGPGIGSYGQLSALLSVEGQNQGVCP